MRWWFPTILCSLVPFLCSVPRSILSVCSIHCIIHSCVRCQVYLFSVSEEYHGGSTYIPRYLNTGILPDTVAICHDTPWQNTSYPYVWGKVKILMSKTDEKTLHGVKTRYWIVTGFVNEPEFDKFTMTWMWVGREICPKTGLHTMKCLSVIIRWHFYIFPLSSFCILM